MPAQLDAHDHENPASTSLEWGELWSFVLKKTNQAWIWIALHRESRQFVAYEIGDRSQSSFRRLWEAISISKLVQATVSWIECVLLLANLYLAKLHDWFYIRVIWHISLKYLGVGYECG